MTATTRTLVEMALVLATGLGLGLAANAASANGLDLARDYFPKAAPVVTTPESPGDPESPTGVAPAPSEHAPDDGGAPAADPASLATQEPTERDTPIDPVLLDRLASKGLAAVTFREVSALYQDPMYAYEAYVFIDARDDHHYGEGHIPGAHQFDHFRAERFQEQMLQLLPTSMRIVVYCTGGDCEDSESAALFLLGLGADPGRLSVYTGGITEWRERGMPIERGALHSGDIVPVEETP